MVRQFLRRMFAGRKNEEEREEATERPEMELMEDTMEAEETKGADSVSGVAVEEKVLEERRAEPYTYVITRDKIEHHSYKQIFRLIEEILEQIERGLRGEGRLQLRLSPDLAAETDEFFGKRIGKYIEGAERETYDATAFFDWTDEETARIYRTYVLPVQPEKQHTFVQSRLVMIYDTCEALGWDARRVVGMFTEAIGWELKKEDFIRFERWLDTMSQRLEDEDTLSSAEHGYGLDSAELNNAEPEARPEAEEDEFAHITPLQVSREEVEKEDITKLAAFFDDILSDPKRIREKRGGLVFSFYGFSGELEDVMGDEGVNAWASRLVEQYPYVFYFLNDEYVPMTRFVTSMVVTSRMEGDEVVYDAEELDEFIEFIQTALARLADWTGEDASQVIQEFEQKLFQT